MKNLHVILIMVIIATGFIVPVTPAKANPPTLTTVCLYLYEGVEISELQKQLPGNVSCPAFPPHHDIIDILRRYGFHVDADKDDPNDSSVDCGIVSYTIAD